MAEYQPQAFAYGDIALSETVDIDGIPHVTRSAVGEWLEYADPQKAIDKLLERNPHIEHYATPVNLTAVDGKNREILVYHPIGFLLLVMESGQPRAQSMKVAVAEFVWHFAGPRHLEFKDELALMKLQRVLFLDLARVTDLFVRQGLLGRLARVSRQLGQPLPKLEFLGSNMDQLRLPEV